MCPNNFSYFGRYLHTGDLRFNEYMWSEYKYLYPPELSPGPEGLPRSIQIDELILDNTYCDPIFDFPKREKCLRMAVDVINKNIPCDVYFISYTAGKEELFVEVARKFNTRMWCSKERYRDLHALGFGQYFTVDTSEAWMFLNLIHTDDQDDEWTKKM